MEDHATHVKRRIEQELVAKTLARMVDRMRQAEIRSNWKGAYRLARVAERDNLNDLLDIHNNGLAAAAHNAVVARLKYEVYADVNEHNRRWLREATARWLRFPKTPGPPLGQWHNKPPKAYEPAIRKRLANPIALSACIPPTTRARL